MDRPILFSGPMVRALLAGLKTQTRRVVQPGAAAVVDFYSNEDTPACVSWSAEGHAGPGWYVHSEDYPDEGSTLIRCPYGQPGDRLWVRETFVIGRQDKSVLYAADGWNWVTEDGAAPFRWSPSIHMPRWASRLTLELTAVRVERLQDITEEDAKAEGCESAFRPGIGPKRFVYGYRDLWESINAKRGFGWATNPWVWVLTFKRAEAQEVAA